MSQANLREPEHYKLPPAVKVLLAFAGGILLDRYCDIDFRIALIGSVLLLFSWLLFRSKSVWSATALLLACLFAGSFWHHGRWNWFPANDILTTCTVDGVPVCIKARILGEGKHSAQPEHLPFDAMPGQAKVSFEIEPLAIRDADQWRPLSGRARLEIRADHQRPNFGDVVVVYGSVMPFQQPTSPGQFDIQDFYRAANVTATVYVFNRDSVLVAESGNGYEAKSFLLKGFLSRLRQHLNSILWKHVDQQYAGFASAILLGNREQLDYERRHKFVATGTAHLLAISGLHLGILASVFLLLYQFGLLRRRNALIATMLFVFFYAWLVEFQPPVTRAAILLQLFCLGRLIGRSGFEFNLLAIAGLLILIVNPNDLFSLGPQLSFLAVASFIVFKEQIAPPLSKDPIDILIRSTRPWYVRAANNLTRRAKQALVISGLIWLVGLPLVAANYHLVTPIALLVNPFVLLPVACALFCGLGVLLTGLIAPPIADLFGFGLSSSLSLASGIIDFAESMPASHWWTSGPSGYAVVVFYLLLLSLVLVQPVKRFKYFVLFSVCWLGLFWLLPFHGNKVVQRVWHQPARCTFLDMGHGSGVWVQLSDGRNLLYDAGSMSSSRFAADRISQALWSQDVEHLDAIIVSHADLDHFNAIPELVRRFSIGVVYCSVPMQESQNETTALLFETITNQEIPIRTLGWHDSAELQVDELMKVHMPPDIGTGGNDNSDSIVLSLRLGNHVLLLPGDLEKVGMKLLLQKPPVDCDIAMLPHHGSRNSQPVEFVRWSRPEKLITSSGRRKLDKSVTKSMVEIGIPVYATAERGTIRATFLPEGIQMEHWCNDRWEPSN